MSSALDYEKIAHLYDSYLRFTDDLPFFIQECQKTKGSVLELMCGTGRISIPLLEAGVHLTCVDASPAMLAIFRQKLTEKRLNASVIQAGVTALKFSSQFDLILLPFQSFHELKSKTEQRQFIDKIAELLNPNGRFICTLHNPEVRLKSIGKTATNYGQFPRVDGAGFVSLSVELNAQPETGMVSGYQTIYELDEAQNKVAEHKLPVQFSLIELDAFQELLKLTGFGIEEVFGNYDYSPFIRETSPYMIVSSCKLND
ncbi:class I SAM-dependent methyltransferase [Capilliphycus salinus ALCB114379]|uniref:class I SAM-dependent methyltransferase n=1 Tax=Capilliphycus salinus TaxID=2768948 RepID=UPI0039A54EA8